MEEQTNEKTLEVVDQVEEQNTEEEVVEEETTNEEEVEEDTTEPEFTDTEVKEEKKQTDEENSKFAQIRRKYEEDYKKKLDTEIQKSYERGKLEAYKDKINPYTNEPIVDMNDIQMYETMYQLELEGKDPINDLPNFIIEKERKKQEALQRETEKKEKAQREIEEFKEKYPNIEVKDILEDKFFSKYIQGKQDKLVDMYDDFNALKDYYRNSAVDSAKQTIANSQSTPGSLSNSANNVIDYEHMSSEEFAKYREMAVNGELR